MLVTEINVCSSAHGDAQCGDVQKSSVGCWGGGWGGWMSGKNIQPASHRPLFLYSYARLDPRSTNQHASAHHRRRDALFYTCWWGGILCVLSALDLLMHAKFHGVTATETRANDSLDTHPLITTGLYLKVHSYHLFFSPFCRGFCSFLLQYVYWARLVKILVKICIQSVDFFFVFSR